MKCDFEYCIYNVDCACSLKEPAINSFGMCEYCILVSIPKAMLKQYKKQQLEAVEECKGISKKRIK